jgi:teichoic acid transport system permease protein
MFSVPETSARPEPADDYLGEFHVYERHKAGLPPLRQYFRELWRRREFAVEMSRANIRASNSNTLFGVLWNVLNPMLLAAVYFLLVTVIRGGKSELPQDYFAHLLGGLFAFYFVSGCMAGGASSVTAAGKIIMNTAFPRILLVFSAVFIAFRKFLPTMLVYIPVALITHVGIPWTALLAIPMFFLIMVFGTGMGMLLATSQVYFRDTTSFLPYFTRIWLYLSPVLWYPEAVNAKLKPFEVLNPLFSLLGGWGDLLVRGELIPWSMWLLAIVWSFGTLLVGSFVFMSRERDFAVRL